MSARSERDVKDIDDGALDAAHAAAGGHSVEKIGGTSMARTHSILHNVLLGGRKGDELYGRAFVVSAYAGITDLLLEHKKTGEPGVYALFASAESDWAWGDALSRVGERMCEINSDVFASELGAREMADRFVRERIEGVRSCLIDLQRLCSYGHFRLDEHLLTVREMLAALGEAHSAHNTALLLERHGCNARFVDLTGWRDDSTPTLDERIEAAFADIDLARELPIVTGYAQCREALMGSYDRGYSEVTFARLAALTGAAEAVIHKEFHLSSADPKVVDLARVRVIGETNYDVADQLSNMGMEAIHPRAAKTLRQAAIPLRVRNAFEPQAAGTLILDELGEAEPRVEMITGLKHVFAFEFFEQDMVGVKSHDSDILEALRRHTVRIVAKTCNANTITHFLDASPKAVKRVERDLTERHPGARVSTRKVALVSVIGRNLDIPGLLSSALSALAEAGVEPLGLHRLMRNVDVQFVVREDDHDTTIRALHAALVESERAPVAALEPRPAADRDAA